MRFKHFTYPLITSVLLHAAGLASASRLIELSGPALPSELIPIEVVTTAPTLSPAPLPTKKEVARLKEPIQITPPRIIERPAITLAAAVSTPPSIEEPVLPSPLHMPLAYHREARELLPGSPPSPESAAPARPEPGPLLPLPAIDADGRGNVLGPSTEAKAAPRPASSEGGEAGAGGLSTKGDVALLPGIGVQGGSGGPGRSGLGLGRTGGAEQVTGINPGAGGEGHGGGAGHPIRLARPRGGYQIRPQYPESARRQGIEGMSLLRFQVLANGTVGEILLERSAGYQDLDRAAIEAVKKWRFDPARQGNRLIAVWVTLPVRFELR